MKNGIHIGSQVSHVVHGVGTVVDQWGTWKSCRRCYAMFGTCSCNDPIWIGVCATSTFEVIFDRDHEQRPVNKAWLKKVEIKDLTPPKEICTV